MIEKQTLSNIQTTVRETRQGLQRVIERINAYELSTGGQLGVPPPAKVETQAWRQRMFQASIAASR